MALPSPLLADIQSSQPVRSEEHTSELQSHSDLVCRLLLEKKKKKKIDRRGIYRNHKRMKVDKPHVETSIAN